MFTYEITEAEAVFLKKGMRVAVEFGKSKIYTALIADIHTTPPTAYEAKNIHQILDEHPLVNEIQLKHWNWIASYYMCPIGDVLRAALPSAFLLESETNIELINEFEGENELTDDEFSIYEALQHQSFLTIHQIMELVGKKTVFPIIKSLIAKNAILVKEQIYEQYKPKLVKYVRLKDAYKDADKLSELLTTLNRAQKQREVVLSYFQLQTSKKPIKVTQLQDASNCSAGIINSLVDKDIFEFYFIQTDRINFQGTEKDIKQLAPFQETAYESIIESFTKHQTVLLKGVTSSGKTEIYAKLIADQLLLGKQVLYLVPEIALTTQLIGRLQIYFGNQLSVFHSKYSLNERVEVWNNVLNSEVKAQLIIGARSSLFLPYNNLGLIIVDEEHETSFKQHDPSPRYHARDAAIILAQFHSSKVILGSATPAIESYYNAINGKFGFVEINQRFGNVQLPDIELVDIKEKYRKKRMTGHFSDSLITAISEALELKEQVILFQNRRGYAPVVECETCGISPQCTQCDVSLTFHSYSKELRCHYCGLRRAMPPRCNACGSEKLDTKGFGTEQIEMELNNLFPNALVGRMDLDTTRGKYGYHKIISQFEAQEIEILVGTQMLSKGLDFGNVSLVGILNADNMLNFPDFRAHERSYQLMVQVSGRAGRSEKRGKVLIQTFNPYHQILQQVSTHSFEEMYKEQIDERWQYYYPPFYRIVKLTLRHKNFVNVDEAAIWLGKSMNLVFGNLVLGPSTPSISKIRNYYIRNLILKIPQKNSLKKSKNALQKILDSFQSVKEFRSIRLTIDVDNY